MSKQGQLGPLLESVTIHVDNGGYTFEICDGSIIITDGYFGYSSHQMMLNGKVTPENLRRIGVAFMNAAAKIEIEQRRRKT